LTSLGYQGGIRISIQASLRTIYRNAFNYSIFFTTKEKARKEGQRREKDRREESEGEREGSKGNKADGIKIKLGRKFVSGLKRASSIVN